MDDFRLDGKNILVTGASSGIGRQIALSLSERGASLVITGRDQARLQDTFNHLSGSGHTQFQLELTDQESAASFTELLPMLNGFVHSAGILSLSPLKILSSSQSEEVMKVNYFAPVNLVRLLLNKKKIAGNSSIVFISSIIGVYKFMKGSGGYAASKAALNTITKIFALEYASKKIRFNTVTPGVIKTDMYQKLLKTVSSESVEADKGKYPMGDYGDPIDVANACIYLLSDASKWVTGTSLVVDGGLTIS